MGSNFVICTIHSTELLDNAEHDLKKCGDQGGCYPRPITLSEIYLTLQMTRKPNPIIVLLFSQNNSEFTNKLNHAYPVPVFICFFIGKLRR